ncbi:MAG: hypothetical protein AB1640_01965 [bacterium]
MKLYVRAFLTVPFYRYGEIGNISYNVGKNILDGVILYSMFSMAEEELKVAAVLGVVVKYAYPGITIVSSTYISGVIDRLEAFSELGKQISRLIRSLIGIGVGQALGAVMLVSCFPPLFRYLFYGFSFKSYIIIALYFLHHVLDGSAQIAEGRVWFKMVEIKIRRGQDPVLAHNFWVIHTASQNFQLVLGQVFLWASLGLTTALHPQLTNGSILALVAFGFASVVVSKFILPVTYRLRLCS